MCSMPATVPMTTGRYMEIRWLLPFLLHLVLPCRVERRAVGDQPDVVAAEIVERIVVRKLEFRSDVPLTTSRAVTVQHFSCRSDESALWKIVAPQMGLEPRDQPGNLTAEKRIIA